MQARTVSTPYSTRLSTFLASRAGRVLQYAVSLGLLAAFAALIDWGSFRQVPHNLDVTSLAAAVLLAGSAFPLMAWRWWLLARVLGFRASFGWMHRVTWISQFYASLLPSGLGGEAARSYFVMRGPPEQRAAGLASIVWDRAIGLVLLFAMAATAAVLKFDRVVAHRELGLALAAVTITAVTGVILLWRADPASWPRWVRALAGPERCDRLAGALAPVRRSGRVLSASVALTAFVWLLDFVAIALLARSTHLHPPFLDIAIAGSVAYAASVLPIGVGGHGLREGALVFTLAALGLVPAAGPERDAALVVALLLWAVTVFWSLVGGVIALVATHRR